MVRGVAGNARVDEAHGAANQRVDRIGHAEIGPAVAAGTGDDDFEAARSQRFGGDVVDAGAVENDDGFQAVTIGIDERAHAAEIAFAFFADVGDKQNGALRLDARFVNGARDGHQRRQAGTVVGNSRRAHAIAFAMNFDVGAGGKNGIEMRGRA